VAGVSTSDGSSWGDLTPPPAAFAIAAPPQLEIGPTRQGSTAFTVTNLTGRPVRARLLPRALQGADPSWFTVPGPPELPMGVGATVTATIIVTVPPTAPGGSHLLRLDVVPEDDTEAEVTGPSVAIVVPPPVVAQGRPKWLLPLLIGVLVLILGAGGAIYFLSRPDRDTAVPAPVTTRTQAPSTGGLQWSEWEELGGSVTAPPAAASWAPGRLDVFARGSSGELFHRAWTAGGVWSEFATPRPGATIIDSPATVSWGPDRLDTFVRGTDNQLWTIAWVGNTWYGFYPMGGVLTSSPAVASWSEGRLDVFVRGSDNALYRRAWNGSAWLEYEGLGGNLKGAPAAVSRAENTIDVFFRGTNNHLYQKSWDGARWSSFKDLGGSLSSDPSVSSWGSDRLDVFAQGDDNTAIHKSWDGNTWTDWATIGRGVDGSPAAVSQEADRIDIFARGTNNELLHKTLS